MAEVRLLYHLPLTKLNRPRYCIMMNEDSLAFLQHCSKEDIMTFWKWILDYYYVRKKSTLYEYWRVWRMLYRRCVGRSLHAKITRDINNMRILL
jgi:hypothetical protein